MKISSILLLVLTVVSCRTNTNKTSQSKPPPPILLEAPVDFSVLQRTTTALPGSEGKVMMTIDDIPEGKS